MREIKETEEGRCVKKVVKVSKRGDSGIVVEEVSG